MIMQKQTLFLVLFMTAFLTVANAQSVIVPAGGDAQGSTGSVSYTVGQIAVQTAASEVGSVSVSEGVQQPYEIQTVGVNNYPQIVLNAKVYPNPTENLAQLELNGFEIPDGGLRAYLYDGNGKLLQTVTVTDDITTFQIGHYATGSYLLDVKSGNRSLKTFKIVRK